jgi:hypothetical protein
MERQDIADSTENSTAAAVPTRGGPDQPLEVPTASAAKGTSDEVRKHLISLGTNVTVITALLVYFGWKRADTQSRVLGVDESIFGMSTVDYVLRSVDALFLPIGVGAFIGLGAIWLDSRLRRRLAANRDWPALEHVTRVLAYAWLLLPLLVYGLGQLWSRIGLFGYPLSFGVGVLLTVYAAQLRRSLAGRGSAPGPGIGWHTELMKALIGVIVVLSLFWSITNYANYRGVSLAVELMDGIAELPSVVVYSPGRLAIDAPGVTERRVDGADAQLDAQLYRYEGLRLLDHIGDRFFLISDGFSRSHGVVVALPDDGSLRYEFVRDRR